MDNMNMTTRLQPKPSKPNPKGWLVVSVFTVCLHFSLTSAEILVLMIFLAPRNHEPEHDTWTIFCFQYVINFSDTFSAGNTTSHEQHIFLHISKDLHSAKRTTGYYRCPLTFKAERLGAPHELSTRSKMPSQRETPKS